MSLSISDLKKARGALGKANIKDPILLPDGRVINLSYSDGRIIALSSFSEEEKSDEHPKDQTERTPS